VKNKIPTFGSKIGRRTRTLRSETIHWHRKNEKKIQVAHARTHDSAIHTIHSYNVTLQERRRRWQRRRRTPFSTVDDRCSSSNATTTSSSGPTTTTVLDPPPPTPPPRRINNLHESERRVPFSSFVRCHGRKNLSAPVSRSVVCQYPTITRRRLPTLTALLLLNYNNTAHGVYYTDNNPN